MRMITLLIALSAIVFATSCKRQVIKGVVIAKGETEYAIEHIDKGVLPFEFRSVAEKFHPICQRQREDAPSESKQRNI